MKKKKGTVRTARTVAFFRCGVYGKLADKGLDLVDRTISDSCVTYQVLRCIQVSLLCVEDGAIDRPTVSDMLSMLTNGSTKLPLPKKPAFSIARKQIEANIPNKESNIYTRNGLYISDMDAR